MLRPVQRLGDAARRLGEGRLDTRLRVSGTDELAELSRTFNSAAEALQGRVEELSAREAASRRFVADMSHELRTPLTAITAVTEVLEDEADSLDPMIAAGGPAGGDRDPAARRPGGEPDGGHPVRRRHRRGCAPTRWTSPTW